ncbi:MAG: amidohydrolase [Saprospiraceae bacterium]|nr:amidohydrolase [Saprospiraceae bacterium]
MMKKWWLIPAITIILGCNSQPPADADLILTNGIIATMDEQMPEASAVAVRSGKIVAVGGEEILKRWKSDSTEVIDVQGNFIMPGFIEAHGHFSGLGSSLQNLNFLRSRSWDEIVDMVSDKVKISAPGEWIIGRGWHQEKWVRVPEENVHGYPYHDELSEISPENPVLLFHASGHGAFANEAAMKAAGISRETPDPMGGEIVRDNQGKAIGMFEERAQGLLRRAYQEYLATLSEQDKLDQWYEGIQLASQECLAKGITSFQDAGSSFEWIDRYRQLAEEGKLDLRLWVMIRHSAEEMKDRLSAYPWIGIGDNMLTVRAIKSEVDGALGSFGAWLLEPYDDKPDFVGQNTTEVAAVAAIADLAYDHGLQLCVHAIGDRANHEVLNIFQKYYEKAISDQNDLRWRIEHAQHLAVEDIPRFAEMGVIAAMQGIHCTSDAPFVEKRLGHQRAEQGAYAWRSLLDAGAVIANGTDAPVEDVNPLESFYASVTRKRIDNGFEFFPGQAMTRYEALRSYTLDAAYAGFEEDVKGSIEVGKLADFTVLSQNLLDCAEEDILKAKVLYTIVGGEPKYTAE